MMIVVVVVDVVVVVIVVEVVVVVVVVVTVATLSPTIWRSKKNTFSLSGSLRNSSET